MPSAIPAAGTIPWRLRDGRLEVALVHRPRYGDWSWPKGKVDPGEEWPVAAVRETREETGLTAHLGIPLPDATYTVMSRTGTPDEKRVRYWAATVTGPAKLWRALTQSDEAMGYLSCAFLGARKPPATWQRVLHLSPGARAAPSSSVLTRLNPKP